MKNILFTAAIVILLTGCNSTKTTTQTTSAETTESEKKSNTISLGADDNWTEEEIAAQEAKPKKTMLLGIENRQALLEEPFGTWFNANYKKYKVKTELVPELSEALENVEITTFMGTWCGDSKRETPRFFKIIDAADYGFFRSTLIAVDRTKQNPKEFTESKNIVRVPTFIFKRDGKELGRIVERPVESLEADMLKILNGEPYKHAYEN